VTPSSRSSVLASPKPSGAAPEPDLVAGPPSPWSASAALASDLLAEAEETIEEWYAEADAEISSRLDEVTRHTATATRLAREARSLLDEVRTLLADAAADRDQVEQGLEDPAPASRRTWWRRLVGRG